jgi:hypothetical protein
MGSATVAPKAEATRKAILVVLWCMEWTPAVLDVTAPSRRLPMARISSVRAIGSTVTRAACDFDATAAHGRSRYRERGGSAVINRAGASKD